MATQGGTHSHRLTHSNKQKHGGHGTNRQVPNTNFESNTGHCSKRVRVRAREGDSLCRGAGSDLHSKAQHRHPLYTLPVRPPTPLHPNPPLRLPSLPVPHVGRWRERERPEEGGVAR
jgi:hypothetical protein